jgi:hypothetical protein
MDTAPKTNAKKTSQNMHPEVYTRSYKMCRFTINSFGLLSFN